METENYDLNFPIEGKQLQNKYYGQKKEINPKEQDLRDVPWDDIFKLGTSAAASEFCEWVQVGTDVYIPHRNQTDNFTFRTISSTIITIWEEKEALYKTSRLFY